VEQRLPSKHEAQFKPQYCKKKDNTHAIISVSRFPAYMGDQEGCSAEIKKTKEEISNFST
jgi:hypothetical protein